jgi:hypothetical protein
LAAIGAPQSAQNLDLPDYRFRTSRKAYFLVWANLPAQFVEQRLGVFEIGGVEAFGEPV